MKSINAKKHNFILLSLLLTIVMAFACIGLSFKTSYVAYAVDDIEIDDIGDIGLDDNVSEHGDGNQQIINNQNNQVANANHAVNNVANPQGQAPKTGWGKYDAATKNAIVGYGVKTASSVNDLILDIIKNKGATDYLKYAVNIFKSGAAMAATIYFGSPAAGAAVDGGLDMIFKWFHIGETSQSELQMLESRLNDQFDRLSGEIDDVKRQVADLSDKLEEEIEKVLNKIDESFEAYYAKTQVTDFMYSTSGNFSYNLLRRYLYSATQDGVFADLASSVAKQKSEQEIQRQYNNLYKALARPTANGDSYLNMFSDYFIETATRKSISHYYYDYLSSNQSYIQGNASVLTVEFASQVYYDYLTMLNTIRFINAYQLTQIYLQNADMPKEDRYENGRYFFDQGQDDYVTAKDIDDLNKLLDQRQQDAYNQMLKDVEYILGLQKSYLVEEEDKMLRYVTQNDVGTFGNLVSGETVYLNQVIAPFANRFFLDTTLFDYKFIGSEGQLLEQNTKLGYLKVGYQNTFKGVVEYNGTVVYEINFRVNDNTNFVGGKGTTDDPYVIATKEQYKLAYNFPKNDQSFLLIKDLDFSNTTLNPLASKERPYNATFNGAGHKIKNVKVSLAAEDTASLFGVIGESGVVKNLELEGISIRESGQNDAKKIVSGVLASVNNGVVYSCYVASSTLYVLRESSTNHDNLNKAITMLAGGLVGENNGAIKYCKVESTSVSANSKRFYSANSDATNRNNVYTGGLVGINCATIENCYVASSVSLSAYGENTMDEGLSLRYPYINIYIGGLAGYTSSLKGIKNVHSDVILITASVYVKNEAWSGGSFETHCEKKTDVYIPDQNNLSSIKTENRDIYKISTQSKRLEYAFGQEQDEEFGCSKDLVYDGRDTEFRLDNLKLTLVTTNGSSVTRKELDYSIIGVYGFNSKNSSKTDNIKRELMLKVFDNTNNAVYTLNVGYNVRKNAVYKLTVTDTYRNQFEKDSEVSSDIYTALGTNYVEGVYYDGTTENIANHATFEIDTTQYGNVKGIIKYGDLKEELDCVIVCNLDYDLEERVITSLTLSEDKTTCMVYGYILKTCSACGKQQYETIAKEYVTHILGYRQSTCSVPGYSGDICVTASEFGSEDIVVAYGEVLPLVEHHYDYSTFNVSSYRDEHFHYCTECGHQDVHMYQIIENENELVCTCVICGYTTKAETNSREKIRQLPRVVVSDAYSIGDGDVVKVFIDLHASTGITAANFTVNFDNNLTLISYKYGNILNGNDTIDAFKVYKDHLNVMLAQSGTDYKKDGTILTLVFKTPNDTIPGEAFKIEVTNKDNKDKFTDENGERTEFVAYSGKIIIVSHLPGDINGDDVVDLVDAVIVSNYVVLDRDDQASFIQQMQAKNPNFDMSYADVNLDGSIDISDIVQILRYTAGGYETTFVANLFEIILNYNNGTDDQASFMVRYDNGNSTFGSVMTLPELTKEGYKFMGWYTDFNGGGIHVTNDTKVFYNREQYRQTLYAYFIPNTITFDANGGVGTKPSLNYMSNVDLSNKYDALHSYLSKQSLVVFNENGIGTNSTVSVNHTFLGWALSPDGPVVYGENDTIDLCASGYNGVGNVVLYAVWSSDTIAPYEPEISGYEFLGWTGGNSGDVVWDGKTPYTITEDTTFYAKWRKKTFSFVYRGNGGQTQLARPSYTEEITRSVTNFAYPLMPNSFVREGYEFLGWAFTNTTFAVAFIDEYTLTEPDFLQAVEYVDKDGFVSLYAIWQGNNYTIVFDKNNAEVSGEMENLSATYGQSINLNQCVFTLPNGSHMHFAGWSLYSDGDVMFADGELVSNLTSIKNATIKLYAIWQYDVYYVHYTMSGYEVLKDEVSYNSQYMFRTNLAVLGESYFDYAIYDYSENVSYEKGDTIEHWTLERDVSIQIRLLYTGTDMFRITTLETEGEAKIAAYVNHKSIDVVLIPHFIREDYGQPIYTITRLAKKSFYSPINVQDLKVYVIPNTVNTIDAQVFMRAGAKEIYMTDSVTVLEYEVFAGITSLQKLVLSHNAVMAHGNPFTSMSVEKLYYTSTYQNWHTEYMDRFNIDYQQVYFYNTNPHLTPGYQYWMYDTNGIIIER